ncbi:LysR family transcriptional regulator [Dyella sp.]|uniref:LysR family transcriptional regulator n=1 Tax=Dyella sp. TaxID=1869338 RepID=UPI002ED026C6
MKRSLPLNALRVFQVAAQHLSFTKASEELSLTAAAVSQQVKLLEQHLGMALFVRSNNKLSLTPAGERYFPRVREAFRALQHATAQLLDQKFSLRVAVPATFGTKWLVPRLFRFFGKHPDIDVAVLTEAQLEAGAWDIAIEERAGEEGPHVLVATDYVPVCGPVLASQLTQPSDLNAVTLLYERSGRRSAIAPDWNAWMAHAGAVLADTTRELGLGDGTMMLQAAIEGQGVALAQRLLIAYDVAAGRLVEPFAASTPWRHAYHLTVAQGVADRSEVSIFCEWLRAEVLAS